MHIGIVTYQTGHKKTLDVIRRFLPKGYEITVLAFPFQKRPHVVTSYEDRPYQILDMDMEAFCETYNINYIRVSGWDEASIQTMQVLAVPDVFVTCIAKIIPQHLLRLGPFVNAHPGLLPHNRGVDAFKWALFHKWPLGVTLHVIDREIDRGTILKRARVPIYNNDTLKDVCMRSYELECDLIGDIERYLPFYQKGWGVTDDYPLSRKSVSAEFDSDIENYFVENREIFMNLSVDLTAQAHESDGVIDETTR
ncbi:formyltransferase family protein [Magnetovibrio sp. PR-2]|uniref:formyltransferase family protein n=1 Tax=Magnetovibrio sp. PR-2 TaxID=3120356 RepID=UPI002FCDE2BD